MDPLLWVCCAVVAGVALAGNVDLPASQLAVAVVVGVAVALQPALRGAARSWGPAAGLALCGLVVGVMLVRSMPSGPRLTGPVTVQGVVVGARFGGAVDVSVTRWAAPGHRWEEASGRVRVRFPELPPPPGSPVAVYGRARPIGASVLPGAPDPVRAASLARIRTLVRAESHAVLGGSSARAPPVERYGVLRALATGDRSGVSEDTWSVLRNTGTAHLLAISGFHVGAVALAVGGAVGWLVRWGAVARPRGLPTAPALFAGACAAAAYAWAAGAPVSAMRAAGLFALVAVARATGRSVRPLRLLGVVAVGLLVADPSAAATPSFQLSFGAVVGLVRVVPLLVRWLPPDLPWLVDWAARALAATVAATIGTLPAAAWWFQQLAPTSAVANLFALPWTAFVIAPCAAVAAYGPPLLANGACEVGDLVVHVLLVVLRPLAVAPLTPAVGPLGALGLLVILIVPHRIGPCVVAGVLSLSLRTSPVDRMVVTFLDVGQGDAALVEFPDGTTWLVDGGPPGRRVADWLRRRGIRRLDVVAATHGQSDHIGGLAPVLESVRVGELWIGSDRGLAELVALAEDQGIPIRRRPTASLHPAAEFDADDLNDLSVVLAPAHRGARVLLTGDVEREGERALVRRGVADVAVLKVPHHGSRTSSSVGLIEAVEPSIAVVSAGRFNPFGHPHPAVMARYRDRHIPVWRTDQHGTVEVSIDRFTVRVRAFRAGVGWSDTTRYPR